MRLPYKTPDAEAPGVFLFTFTAASSARIERKAERACDDADDTPASEHNGHTDDSPKHMLTPLALIFPLVSRALKEHKLNNAIDEEE